MFLESISSILELVIPSHLFFELSLLVNKIHTKYLILVARYAHRARSYLNLAY